jgi:hypothetical protein
LPISANRTGGLQHEKFGHDLPRELGKGLAGAKKFPAKEKQIVEESLLLPFLQFLVRLELSLSERVDNLTTLPGLLHSLTARGTCLLGSHQFALQAVSVFRQHDQTLQIELQLCGSNTGFQLFSVMSGHGGSVDFGLGDRSPQLPGAQVGFMEENLLLAFLHLPEAQ